MAKKTEVERSIEYLLRFMKVNDPRMIRDKKVKEILFRFDWEFMNIHTDALLELRKMERIEKGLPEPEWDID